MKVSHSSAHKDFLFIIESYEKLLPRWTFPYLGFTLAGMIVFVAWFGGRVLFPTFTLIPRILSLWSIALLEYIVLIPTIGASVEILEIPESTLAVLIHAAQLAMFFLLNNFLLKSVFTLRHAFAFSLMIFAIFLVAF